MIGYRSADIPCTFMSLPHDCSLASSIARPCCSSLSSHAARLDQTMWEEGSAASDSPYLTFADSKSAARKSLLPSSLSLLPSSSLSDGDSDRVFAVGDGGRSADVAEGDVG